MSSLKPGTSKPKITKRNQNKNTQRALVNKPKHLVLPQRVLGHFMANATVD